MRQRAGRGSDARAPLRPFASMPRCPQPPPLRGRLGWRPAAGEWRGCAQKLGPACPPACRVYASPRPCTQCRGGCRHHTLDLTTQNPRKAAALSEYQKDDKTGCSLLAVLFGSPAFSTMACSLLNCRGWGRLRPRTPAGSPHRCRATRRSRCVCGTCFTAHLAVFGFGLAENTL